MPDVRTLSRRYRSIFISDVHLGYRGCAADALLAFLHASHCEHLYLVGDIFDIWEMKRRGIYWPPAHSNVIRAILSKASEGTKVTYIPGNHDEALREYVGSNLLGVEVKKQAMHETADGKRLLVLHGDEFDTAVQASRFIAHLGSQMYDALLELNYWLNVVRRKLGFPYWSLATHIKHKVKNAVEYINSFERAVVHEAHRRKVDGVICGHIHRPRIAEVDGVLYCNDGDWVENCSALVESPEGTLSLVHWHQQTAAEASISPKTIAA
jgi:UDP-2,3-diacylglucosamine pyrophosphatase LpxH